MAEQKVFDHARKINELDRTSGLSDSEVVAAHSIAQTLRYLAPSQQPETAKDELAAGLTGKKKRKKS